MVDRLIVARQTIPEGGMVRSGEPFKFRLVPTISPERLKLESPNFARSRLIKS